MTGWPVGDRVTTPFVLACGTCRSCAARRPAGLRAPAPARLHAVGVVRRAGGAAARRRQPGAGARRGRRRTSPPASAAASPRRTAPSPRSRRCGAGEMGRRARLRRGRAVGGDGRGRPRRPGVRRRRRRGLRSRWRRPSGRPRSTPATSRRCPTSPAAAPTSPSTRSAAARRSRARWPACGRAAGTCRSGCCSGPTPTPRGRRWAGWSRRSCSCSAATGCPAASYPELLALVADGTPRPGAAAARPDRPGRGRPPGWPRSASPAPGTGGITVIRP